MANVTSRKKTYIITRSENAAAGDTSVDFDQLAQSIAAMAGELDTLNQDASGTASPSAVIGRSKSDVSGLESLVVTMSDAVKERIENEHVDQLIIEEDEPLYPMDLADEFSFSPQNIAITADTERSTFDIRTVDKAGNAVANVRVDLAGLLSSDRGVTDASGRVSLTLYGESPDSLTMLSIKPSGGYWSQRIADPELFLEQENPVALAPVVDDEGRHSLKSGIDNRGWGQREMGMAVDANAGSGVRIAVIDSGLFADHAELNPSDGRDFGDSDSPGATWRKDASGHGTHVSGVCAASLNQQGIAGFCPGAELFGLRIFPNASNAKLIEALDWCIDHGVDLINMSLGGKNGLEAVRQRLVACRENGILPIAAAGNSGGDVMFPAAFDEVVAVAALGKRDTFSKNTGHQRHIDEGALESGDLFVPRFSCRGKQIDLCAPGVAVISTVPPQSYAAWDGTSMACPHVTGFAGQLLQLRQDLAAMPRNAARATKLFDAIVSQCRLLDGIPPDVQGRGMPRFEVTPPADGSSSLANTLKELRELVETAVRQHEAEQA